MKTYGARIYCSVCHAEPYPDNPRTTRETFDLARVGDDWFCEQHRPAKKERAPRVAAAKPLEALGVFEELLEAQVARLLDETTGDDDPVVAALEASQQELGRGFAELKKALGE